MGKVLQRRGKLMDLVVGGEVDAGGAKFSNRLFEFLKCLSSSKCFLSFQVLVSSGNVERCSPKLASIV